MSIRNLEVALAPGSVAVIGAEAQAGAAGAVVLDNILQGGFAGPVWPVNPSFATLRERACFARVADLPAVPDLGVVTLPPEAVPGAIAELGAVGCRLAVVVSGGLTGANGLRQAMLDAARPYLLRVVGPDALGLIVPGAKLNASFAPVAAAPGRLALISQSGAIATVLLDWAAEHGIGFSQVVALGEMADVDVADCLDLVAGDGRTRAILVYLETVPQARKFLSAARAAARLKPVIAIKPGRSALSGSDEVVDAALRRAGILRVHGLSELFAAAETVARFRPMERARLAVVTNSGGAGALAIDRLEDGAGLLADLAPATLERLDAALPAGWRRENPVDLHRDATPARYLAALEAVAADPGVDAILAMNCPTAQAAPVEAARALAGRVEKGQIDGKPVLACWMGGVTARAARALMRTEGVASYDTPAAAAAAVGHLTDWGRAQAALLRVPDRRTEAALSATPETARPPVAALFAAAAAEGRRVLTAPEAQAVLAAYGIPVPELRVAGSAVEAGDLASDMLKASPRLVVKLLSRDVRNRSDLGGVVLDIATPAEAEAAALAIEARLRAAAPAAALDGFALQPMVRRPAGRELILGVSRDPVFGPVIRFGAGGVAAELLRDTAIALPPLDSGLAAELVARTRAGAWLAGLGGAPPADAPALYGALIALSHLIEDFPCLRAVDVNPLVADAEGVVALDTRMEIEPDDLDRRPPNPDLAIRPYPAEWRRTLERDDGAYALRPIRPSDALLYPEFLEHTAPDDLRLRFMAVRRHFPDDMALRLSQLDYDRDMAFVALTPEGAMAGVARMSCDPDHRAGEYALIVRSDLQGRGIGAALMRLLIDYARADGVQALEGTVLSENRGMRGLVEHLGFRFEHDPADPGVVMSRLDLRAGP